MALRPGSSLFVVALLIVASCSSDSDSSTTSAVPLTTTTETSTTTSQATSTTTPEGEGERFSGTISVPDGPGPHDAIVLVHGGGWIVGTPRTMDSMAAYLSTEGFLVFNTEYKLSFETPGFPEALNDVACAVREAATDARSTGNVTVIGHSAGAHLGAVVALAADRYATDCLAPGPVFPNNFVGLSGPYDIGQLGLIMIPFFGAGQDEAPESWEAANPLLLAGRNPDLNALLIHGEEDPVVDFSFSRQFSEALAASGVDAVLEVLPAVDHPGTRNPSVTGQMIVDWILSKSG